MAKKQISMRGVMGNSTGVSCIHPGLVLAIVSIQSSEE